MDPTGLLDGFGDFFAFLPSFNIGFKLVDLFKRSVDGDEQAQTTLSDVAKGAAVEIAVVALDVGITASDAISEGSNTVALTSLAVGQPEIAGPSGVVSDASGGVSVALKYSKAALTGKESDQNDANKAAVGFFGSLLIGHIGDGINSVRKFIGTPELSTSMKDFTNLLAGFLGRNYSDAISTGK